MKNIDTLLKDIDTCINSDACAACSFHQYRYGECTAKLMKETQCALTEYADILRYAKRYSNAKEG